MYIKNWQKYIREFFETTFDVRWQSKDYGAWVGFFNVNEKEYKIDIKEIENYVYFCKFYLKEGDVFTTRLIGTTDVKNTSGILNTIKQALVEFITQEKPNGIIFDAAGDSESRTNLYRKYCDYIELTNSEYTKDIINNIPFDNSKTFFAIRRKKIPNKYIFDIGIKYLKGENRITENFYNKFKTPFNELDIDDYFCLYYDNRFIGYFKVLGKYSSDPLKPVDSMNVQKHNEDGTFDPAKGNFVIPIEDFHYTFLKLEKVISSGIVFVYNQKLLLVHPTNHTEHQYSFPKGELDPNEDIKSGAIREVREEIGIEIDSLLLLDENLRKIELLRQKNFKTYCYFLVYLTTEQFKKYFNTLVIPKRNLQLDEVDWAGFVDLKDCKDKLEDKFQSVLNNFQLKF